MKRILAIIILTAFISESMSIDLAYAAVSTKPQQTQQKIAQPTQKIAQPTQKIAQPTQKIAQPTQKIAQPTQKIIQPSPPIPQHNRPPIIIKRLALRPPRQLPKMPARSLVRPPAMLRSMPAIKRPPLRPFFRSYPQFYTPHLGYGFFWGLPFLFTKRPEVRVQVDSYIVNTEYVDYDYDIEPSSQMKLNMQEAQRLNDELRAELRRSPVDKDRVIDIYLDIREISQEITDEGFYDYLEIVDSLPINRNYADNIFEIPDDLSFRMRIKAGEVKIMINQLNIELSKRPVNKVKALDMYFKIREGAQEIADERFFDYLDSLE